NRKDRAAEDFAGIGALHQGQGEDGAPEPAYLDEARKAERAEDQAEEIGAAEIEKEDDEELGQAAHRRRVAGEGPGETPPPRELAECRRKAEGDTDEIGEDGDRERQAEPADELVAPPAAIGEK